MQVKLSLVCSLQLLRFDSGTRLAPCRSYFLGKVTQNFYESVRSFFRGLFVLVSASTFICGCSPSTGTGLNVESANIAIQHKMGLPANASDVNFYSDLRTSMADFSINERDFLAWIKTKESVVSKISPAQTASFTSLKNGAMRVITVMEGYKFESAKECGFSGSFDKRTDRAWVVYSCK